MDKRRDEKIKIFKVGFQMKLISHAEMPDKYIGEKNTPNRKRFEAKLKTDILAAKIKETQLKEAVRQPPVVILNVVKDLPKVAIGGRFFAPLRKTTTGKRRLPDSLQISQKI